MKGIVLHEKSVVALEESPEPAIQDPGDVIVRVTTAGICGSDLHIVHGRDRGVRTGTIMGHEFVGVVQEIGDAVKGLTCGDRVLAPFTVNCGECFFCARDLPARCVHSLGFGFVTEEGKGLQGAQAEFVQIPLASSTLMKLPELRTDGSALQDEEVLFLGDIFSTAYSCAENAEIQRGDVVVVVGCGPVGLLSIEAAKLFEPSAIIAVDALEYRLEKAHTLGAIPIRPEPQLVAGIAAELTEGRGADAAIEAVGSPSALDLAIHAVRPGAVVAIAGYHTEPSYSFPIQAAYNKNLTLKIGRCNARKYMTQLLPLLVEKRLSLTKIITHILPLSEGVHAYRIFDQHLEGAIKVLLKP